MDNLIVTGSAVGASRAGLGMSGVAVVVMATECCSGGVSAGGRLLGEGKVKSDEDSDVVMSVGDVAGGMLRGV